MYLLGGGGHDCWPALRRSNILASTLGNCYLYCCVVWGQQKDAVMEVHLPSRHEDRPTEFDVIASLHQPAVTWLLPQVRQNGRLRRLVTDRDRDITMPKVIIVLSCYWLAAMWIYWHLLLLLALFVFSENSWFVSGHYSHANEALRYRVF